MSELMERFKSGKIAVNCRTEKLAKKFLQECEDDGLEWGAFNATHHTNWEHYKEETCYTNSMFGFDVLGFQRYGFYVYEGIEIIEYKEETMTTFEMMAALLENPELMAESESVGSDLFKRIFYDPEVGVFRYEFNDYIVKLKMKVADWRIIKPESREVPFMEAAKALSEGIVVYSIYGGVKTIYRNRAKFLDANNNLVTLTEINKAKWYIEVQP